MNFCWEICGDNGADGADAWKGFAFGCAGTKERYVPNQSARDVKNLSLLGSDPGGPSPPTSKQ